MPPSSLAEATAEASPLRILLLTQHFAPEVTAGRFRVEAFARALADAGHDVQVICPVPNHPRGVIEAGYTGRPLLRRRGNGIAVTYLRVVVVRRKTMFRRLAYYASYAAAASVVGALGLAPDVVLASSPPLSVPAVGAGLARRYGVPLVLDIRDVWPDSPFDLGEMRPGRTLAAAQRLERALYARSGAIVTANEAFRRRIAERSPPHAVIEVIPNGTTREWLEIGEADVSRDEVGFPPDRFIWAYAGNVGLAHGLDHTVDAARRLGGDYRLVVIGEGPRRADLEDRVRRSAPSLIELRGLMPPLEAARHLRAADVVLVSERQTTVVSAKLYDCCAVGRPIVAACRGELERIIRSRGLGLTVPHGDPAALAGAVRRVRSEPGLADELVDRARRFAREHLRDSQARRLPSVVEAVAAKR
jgi:colanic acid biosynthesis glycosyl transferase WcaI